jgi:glycosyltransferase involved in cell wall biosynthesis
MSLRPIVVFFWNQFAPYHIDRIEAVASELGDEAEVCAIEVAQRSARYAWAPSTGDGAFRHIVLAPGRAREDVGTAARFVRLGAALMRLRPTYAFLCHYNQPEVLLTAWLARLCGVRVHCMSDSKFDDRPRRLWREVAKRLWMSPYHGALTAGRRSAAYVRMLGVSERRIAQGYDTVGVARVRRLAETAPAPDGVLHVERDFVVVARFVPKKNLTTAIAAYARYRELANAEGLAPRGLVLCGDGPLRAELEREVERRALNGVRFTGFAQAPEVAGTLGRALALLLPSVEEQWGLVVNEAFALGVPVLASTNVGAADGLIRAGVNGFLFDPFEAEGMARVMHTLAGDAEIWRRFAEAARDSAELGDVGRFVEGVRALMPGDGAPADG